MSAQAINWPHFTELVRKHRSFVLTSHVKPDCDALGSELAMARVLGKLNKQVRIVNGQATPHHLKFLDPEGLIEVVGEQISPLEIDRFEVLMVLDTSAWAQLGLMADVLRHTRATKMVLDHHVSEDDLGAISFKNPHAEATGRLVIEAADQLGVEVTSDIATPAFAALATDTGWFRFNSVTSETYLLAARLVASGAQPDAIYRELYEQDTLARFLLRAIIFTRIQVELEGRLVHTYVLREDFDKTGALPSDTEDVINMTLGIAGTEAAAIFVEQPGGDFKVSLRSRSELDCSKLAAQFGGGGHRAAAGALVKGSFQQVRAQVLDALRAAMG